MKFNSVSEDNGLKPHLVVGTGLCCSSSELSPPLSESVSPVAKKRDILLHQRSFYNTRGRSRDLYSVTSRMFNLTGETIRPVCREEAEATEGPSGSSRGERSALCREAGADPVVKEWGIFARGEEDEI